jgi:hypothetical protein
MYDWSKLKDFRLAKGSHDDPSGGAVCLVEAALLQGGFRYKAIKTAYDAPACFSWIITHYAISLNDQMPDDLRQELLLPFVGRLAWTRRDSATEQRRLKYIAQKIDITGWKANSAMLAGDPVRQRAYFGGAADALDMAISLGTPNTTVTRDPVDDSQADISGRVMRTPPATGAGSGSASMIARTAFGSVSRQSSRDHLA